MDQPLRLLADGRHNPGVAVPSRGHGDATREVEVLVAVCGFDDAAPPRRDLQVGDAEPDIRDVAHNSPFSARPSGLGIVRGEDLYAGLWNFYKSSEPREARSGSRPAVRRRDRTSSPGSAGT